MKRDRPKRTRSYEDVLAKASEVFCHDKDAVLNWYITKQADLGEKSPFEVCKDGGCEAMWRHLNNMLLIQ